MYHSQEEIEKVQPGQTWTHKDGVRKLEVTNVHLDRYRGRWYADGLFSDAEKNRAMSWNFPVDDLLENCELDETS